MDTTRFKAHRLFVIALLVALAHFLVTSVIGVYIALQIGTQMGHAVAEGFIEAYEKSPQNDQKSEEEAKKIYQETKNKSDGIIENWRFPLFLISLPIGPLTNPVHKNIWKALFRMSVSKEIPKKQFYVLTIMIDCIATFINSLSIGFLVYVILRIWSIYKMRKRIAL